MMTLEEFLESRMKTGVVASFCGTLVVTSHNRTGRQILARGLIRSPSDIHYQLFDLIATGGHGLSKQVGITLVSC